MDNHISNGDRVVYIDEYGEFHRAQIDNIWGGEDDATINLCINENGELGPVIGSVQHRSKTTAPGRYWNHA